MTTHRVRCGDLSLDLKEGDVLLDGLLDGGVDAPHACRAGVCQSCRVRVVEGAVHPDWQDGISPADRERGWALACVMPVNEPLVLDWSEANERAQAKVVEHALVTSDVARIRVQTPDGMKFRAGQFCELGATVDGPMRSYSIASLPESGQMEFHIRRVPGGAVSPWLCDQLKAGDSLSVGMPRGDCVLDDKDLDRPLLGVALGTGLAPLLGILDEAIARGHQKGFRLYFGGRTKERLYLVDELKARGAHPGIEVIPVVHDGPAAAEGAPVGDLVAVLEASYPSLEGQGVFLAGDPGMVEKLKKFAFLRGADLDAIRADAFVPNAPAADEAQ